MPRSWRTHADPFADAWGGVAARLALNPGLEALTLFRQLQREHPGRFPDGQLRTFQRRVKTWRATRGPAMATIRLGRGFATIRRLLAKRPGARGAPAPVLRGPGQADRRAGDPTPEGHGRRLGGCGSGCGSARGPGWR